MTAATWITVSRLFVIPIFLYVVQNPSSGDRWLALGLFLVAALTDWLDGYVARRFNQVTDLGKFLDPLVDKLLIFAPLLVLIEWGTLPAWGVFFGVDARTHHRRLARQSVQDFRGESLGKSQNRQSDCRH